MGNSGGKLTPVTVMFRVTNIEENTRQKIHRHMENHTIHYTQRHTQSQGHKPTLLTILQLLPGTIVLATLFYLQATFTARASILIPSRNLESVWPLH